MEPDFYKDRSHSLLLEATMNRKKILIKERFHNIDLRKRKQKSERNTKICNKQLRKIRKSVVYNSKIKNDESFDSEISQPDERSKRYFIFTPPLFNLS